MNPCTLRYVFTRCHCILIEIYIADIHLCVYLFMRVLKYALNECFRMFYERINYSIHIQIESKSSDRERDAKGDGMSATN